MVQLIKFTEFGVELNFKKIVLFCNVQACCISTFIHYLLVIYCHNIFVLCVFLIVF